MSPEERRAQLAAAREDLLALPDLSAFAAPRAPGELRGLWARAERLDANRQARRVYEDTARESWNLRRDFVAAAPPGGNGLLRWSLPSRVRSGALGATLRLPPEARLEWLAWFLVERDEAALARWERAAEGEFAPGVVSALVAVRVWARLPPQGRGRAEPWVARYPVDRAGRVALGRRGGFGADVAAERPEDAARGGEWLTGSMYPALLACSELRARGAEWAAPEEPR